MILKDRDLEARPDHKRFPQSICFADPEGTRVAFGFVGDAWCGPCTGSMPHLVALHRKFAGRPIAVIALHDQSVQSRADYDRRSAYARRASWNGEDLPFRVLLDRPDPDKPADRDPEGTGLCFLGDRRTPLGDQAVDRFIGWPDLEWSHPNARVLRHQRDRVVQVASFQQQNAAEHFLGLRKWSVGDFDLAVRHRQCDRVTGRVERLSAQEMPASPKLIVVGEALFDHSLRLLLRNLRKLRFVDES